ncbi:MAG: RNA polymerase sigma factor [Acidimicrobiales bacterium]
MSIDTTTDPHAADAADVAAALAGDRSAAAALVARHSAAAIRLAAAVCGSPADAQDVAQDAFVKALAALARFDTSRPFRPWLSRIVVNEAHNRRRGNNRRRAREDRQLVMVDSEDTADIVLRQLQTTKVLAAVAALGPQGRDVIACRYFAELSEAETAETLSIPLGTVKSRLWRALRTLRSELEPDGE